MVAGSALGIGSVSAYAGRYTPSFVDAVFRTIPRFAGAAVKQLVQIPDEAETHECEVLASAKQDGLTC